MEGSRINMPNYGAEYFSFPLLLFNEKITNVAFCGSNRYNHMFSICFQFKRKKIISFAEITMKMKWTIPTEYQYLVYCDHLKKLFAAHIAGPTFPSLSTFSSYRISNH